MMIAAHLISCIFAAGATDWKVVGPFNIGDDINMHGEAGTLADAASPAGNPNIIYAGGQNNGASSGVLKSIDGGRHWIKASNGLFNTRVEGLHVCDWEGQHVFVAVIGAIYESKDGAATWVMVPESPKFGTCNQFRNGTINGEDYVFAACRGVIANRKISGGPWNLIPSPGDWARSGYMSMATVPGSNSKVGGCLSGIAHLGNIINTTHAVWYNASKTLPGQGRCVMLCLHPTRPRHFIYTKPPLTYQSLDDGKTFENLNHSNIFHCGIDRQGRLYTSAMGGAFRSKPCGNGTVCKWERFVSFRHQRRTNRTVARGTHDYQRISLNFGGDGVAFPSDQGLFVADPHNASNMAFVVQNGDLSNNIALAAAVSRGDEGGRYIVTTAWDWGPLASWDSGAHWPSWQTTDDGYSAGCIGEGGGAYAMGRSNVVLAIHHHNVLTSHRGGKNMSRFVMPHGATVFGATYLRKAGSRTEPSGVLVAPMFAGLAPWDIVRDVTVACNATQQRGDLALMHRSNHSCLAALDLGTTYGWYKGVNYALYYNGGCMLCELPGNATQWRWEPLPGAYSYTRQDERAAKAERWFRERFDADGDGRVDIADLRATQDDAPEDDDRKEERRFEVPRREDDDARERMWDDDHDDVTYNEEDSDKKLKREERRAGVPSNGRGAYVFKSYNFGLNWTWTLLPPHLAATDFTYAVDPTNGSVLYGLRASTQCITTSLDVGDTWAPCWNLTERFKGLLNRTVTVSGLVFKDSSTFIVLRRRGREKQLPLITKDGGKTFNLMHSLATVSTYLASFSWSWSAKTLVAFGSGGVQSSSHPHTAFLWKSLDDGETWTDETGDIVTMGFGVSQWYNETIYLSSMGQGIFSKVLE